MARARRFLVRKRVPNNVFVPFSAMPPAHIPQWPPLQGYGGEFKNLGPELLVRAHGYKDRASMFPDLSD
eukprot:859917-Alexandrium_andersonii.AAC.1